MSRLADWLARQAPAWLRGEHGPITASQRRALLAVMRCRTPALGGRVYCCGQCGKTDFAYHSCHHRACPPCGGANTAQWTQRQVDRLLPVPYFFWTFTVPEALRALFKRAPQVLHPLLFHAATRALPLRASLPSLHATVPDAVWTRTWNVDVRPAGTGQAVVRYLARYVQRTAISDERILHADMDSVTFRYIDSQTQRSTECKLGAVEFMRRYLLHVPPRAQHRVRYFGWMHPSARRRHAIVETLLSVVIVMRARPDPPPPWHLRCPHCDAFALVFVTNLARGPPSGPARCVIAA